MKKIISEIKKAPLFPVSLLEGAKKANYVEIPADSDFSDFTASKCYILAKNIVKLLDDNKIVYVVDETTKRRKIALKFTDNLVFSKTNCFNFVLEAINAQYIPMFDDFSAIDAYIAEDVLIDLIDADKRKTYTLYYTK